RGPAHRNLTHIFHRNYDRQPHAYRYLHRSTMGWVSGRELPSRTSRQWYVSHVDCDERHGCRSGVSNVHFNIADTIAIGLPRRNLVVSSAAPCIRAIANGFPRNRTNRRSRTSGSASYSIPSDYDRPVSIKVKTPNYIIDYLTKIGTLDLQPSRDTIVVNNRVMTHFILHLSSYIGIGHTKVAPATRVHCCTTHIGGDTRVASGGECAS